MTVANDFTFSQSSLQSYLNCQFQFYLKYVRNLDWPSALLDPWNPTEIERQSGIRFHQLVQNHFLGVPEALLNKHAQEDGNPKMTEWLANFLKSAATNEGGSFYPELSVYARIEDFNFSAKFDLLVLDEKKTHIFDWKTSKNPPRTEWLRKRVQTQLYPLLARSAHQKQFPDQIAPAIDFTYWEASFPDKSIHFAFEQSDLQYAEQLICGLASEIVSKPLDSFNKTTRIEKCTYCLYRTYCQRATVNSENTELEQELLFTGQDFVDKPEEK